MVLCLGELALVQLLVEAALRQQFFVGSALNDVAGIGADATVGFGTDSVLTIEGETSGTFTTHLSGAGTVAVANSTFNVSGDNTAFTGTWQLGSSGSIGVAGTSDAINQALGSGATLSFSSGSLSLKLAAGESALTIDEVLSGAGSLVVEGTVWGLFYPRTTGCNCFPSKAAEIVSGKSSIFATIEFGFFS